MPLTREEYFKLVEKAENNGVNFKNEDGNIMLDLLLNEYTEKEHEQEEQKFFEGQLGCHRYYNEFVEIIDNEFICNEISISKDLFKPLYDLSPLSEQYRNILFSLFKDAQCITIDDCGLLKIWNNYDVKMLKSKTMFGWSGVCNCILTFHVTISPNTDWKDCKWQRPEPEGGR